MLFIERGRNEFDTTKVLLPHGRVPTLEVLFRNLINAFSMQVLGKEACILWVFGRHEFERRVGKEGLDMHRVQWFAILADQYHRARVFRLTRWVKHACFMVLRTTGTTRITPEDSRRFFACDQWKADFVRYRSGDLRVDEKSRRRLVDSLNRRAVQEVFVGFAVETNSGHTLPFAADQAGGVLHLAV